MSHRHGARLSRPLTDHTVEQGKIKQSIASLLSRAHIMIQDTGKRDGAAHSVYFTVELLQRDGEGLSSTDKESCAFTLWLMLDENSKIQTRISAASFGQEFSDHWSKPLFRKNMF